jgi:hypothetical protein
MHRRQFLSSSLAASALTLAKPGEALAQAAGPGHQYYELRKYLHTSGAGPRLTEHYFAEALIPALNRMGITPVGAFALTYGPETPTLYLFIPSASLEALVTADLHLAKDEAFMKAAAPFWNAPASSPAYVRIESKLMRAFDGYPNVTPPAANPKRIFQLRTYESPSNQDHVRKVEMFHSGEFSFFAKAGCGQVFYGDALIGPRLPNLTYMLTFPDMDALNTGWAAFNSNPDWKKLGAEPRFSFEPIVSNVDNLILRPLGCSQI